MLTFILSQNPEGGKAATHGGYSMYDATLDPADFEQKVDESKQIHQTVATYLIFFVLWCWAPLGRMRVGAGVGARPSDGEG